MQYLSETDIANYNRYYERLFSTHPIRGWCAVISARIAQHILERRDKKATFTVAMTGLTPEQCRTAVDLKWCPEMMVYAAAFDLVNAKMRFRYPEIKGLKIMRVARNGDIDLAWE